MIPVRVKIIHGEADITAYFEQVYMGGGMPRHCHVCLSPFRLALIVAEFDDKLARGETGKFTWACYGEHAEATAAEAICTDF